MARKPSSIDKKQLRQWKAVKNLSNSPTESGVDPLVAASGSRVYVMYVKYGDPNEVSTASSGQLAITQLAPEGRKSLASHVIP